MLLPLVASLFYFVWFNDSAWARYLYGAVKFFMVIWPPLTLVVLMRQKFRWRDLWGYPTGWHVLVGLLMGLGLVAAMFLLYLGPWHGLLTRHAGDIRSKVEGLGVLQHYWLFGLFLALIHSFLEEYYWRWFVYGQLRRLGPMAMAHLVAGVTFASHHMVVAGQYFGVGWGIGLGLCVGIGGILWSYMFERQQTVVGAWLCHICADLGILAVGHHALFGTYW